MKYIGIDIGNLTTKAVVLNSDGSHSCIIIASSDEASHSARSALDAALAQAEDRDSGELYIVATGAGGKSVDFSQQYKSINTCLARGVNYLMPTVRTAVDMGAESSNVIKLNDRGRLSAWESQDKCASGTGIFLQQMSNLMKMSLDEMSELSFKSTSRPEISNTCAVFAESEVISHVHRVPPTPAADIIAGVYASMVSRVKAMCKRIGIDKDLAVTGGVARSNGLIHILEDELGYKVLVPEVPQSVAALGAALIAKENVEKGAAK